MSSPDYDLAMRVIVKDIDEHMCGRCIQKNTGCTPEQVINCAKYFMEQAKVAEVKGANNVTG